MCVGGGNMSISMKETNHYASPYANEFKEYIELRKLTLKESTLKSEIKCMVSLDQYLNERITNRCPLSSELMETWATKKPWEKVLTQKKRIERTKKFFCFLREQGIETELPVIVFKNTQSDYIPYIFTVEEMQNIFAVADKYVSTVKSPYLHLTVPLVFRILYGCGLRSSELTNLKVSDIDFEINALCIWNTKFHKSRYVPFSPSLGKRIKEYIEQRYLSYDENTYLFSNIYGKKYTTNEVHYWHMKLLYRAGIAHGGKGYGPRVHDYRHTFAVHSLQKNIDNGQDVMATLPILATYLGHKDLRGTQYYLRLTADLYPYILETLENKYGKLVRGGENNES